jgi:hypothetical protein
MLPSGLPLAAEYDWSTNTLLQPAGADDPPITTSFCESVMHLESGVNEGGEQALAPILGRGVGVGLGLKVGLEVGLAVAVGTTTTPELPPMHPTAANIKSKADKVRGRSLAAAMVWCGGVRLRSICFTPYLQSDA